MRCSWPLCATLLVAVVLCDAQTVRDAPPARHALHRLRPHSPLATTPPSFRPGVALFAGDKPIPAEDETARTQQPQLLREHNATELDAASSLAAYLDLQAVSELHLPTPLNFVFVGFSGDGNMRIDIPPDELQVRRKGSGAVSGAAVHLGFLHRQPLARRSTRVFSTALHLSSPSTTASSNPSGVVRAPGPRAPSRAHPPRGAHLRRDRPLHVDSARGAPHARPLARAPRVLVPRHRH